MKYFLNFFPFYLHQMKVDTSKRILGYYGRFLFIVSFTWDFFLNINVHVRKTHTAKEYFFYSQVLITYMKVYFFYIFFYASSSLSRPVLGISLGFSPSFRCLPRPVSFIGLLHFRSLYASTIEFPFLIYLWIHLEFDNQTNSN